jgi:hypothetical protein
VASPARDHVTAVRLLAAAYESAMSRAPVDVAFDPTEWELPPTADQYMTDAASLLFDGPTAAVPTFETPRP